MTDIVVQTANKTHRFTGIEAVIFDKDGTLACVDRYLICLHKARLQQLSLSSVSALGLQFGVMGTTVDPAGLLAVGSRWENEIVAAAHLAQTGHPWGVARRQVQQAFTAAEAALPNKATLTPLVPGAVDVLVRLQAAGLKLAVASADTQTAVDQFVRHYQLDALLSTWQGVNPQQPDKTYPAFLQQVCRHMDVLPKQVLVCGDSASDARMAQSGGAADFIGFTGGWPRPVQPHLLSLDDGSLSKVVVCQFCQICVQCDE